MPLPDPRRRGARGHTTGTPGASGARLDRSGPHPLGLGSTPWGPHFPLPACLPLRRAAYPGHTTSGWGAPGGRRGRRTGGRARRGGWGWGR